MSQAINCIVFLGNPDDTLSGRSFRQGSLESHKGWKFLENVIDIIFFWEKHHCEMSYYRDVENARYIIDRDSQYK